MLVFIASLLALFSVALARPQTQELSLRLLEGVDSQIIGGQDASPGDWPSHIGIEYFREVTMAFAYICGGFLYKPRYAVTTAHCIQGYPVSDIRLKAGMTRRDDPTNTQILPVLTYRQHPEFSLTAGVPHNIAIITLVSPATIDNNVQVAVMPPDNNNKFEHPDCFQIGFGITEVGVPVFANVLQWVQMTGLTNEECARQVQGVELSTIFEHHFCIQSTPPGRGPCNGDGGSAVYCRPAQGDSSVMYVAGISSWNAGNAGTCNLQFPSVSTRLSYYIDWLEANTPLE